jgi:hypothetical protein
MKYTTNVVWFALFLIILSCSSIGTDPAELQSQVIRFARDYSDTKSERTWEDGYWDTIGKYDGSMEFNMKMELNGTPEFKYIQSNDIWVWVNDTMRLEYLQKRNNIK